MTSNSIRSVSSSVYSFLPGTWQIICASPGSGKSYFVEFLFKNFDVFFALESKLIKNGQLAICQGDGNLTISKQTTKKFKTVSFISDIEQYFDKLIESFENFSCSIVIIDDFLFLSHPTTIYKLRKILLGRLRHCKLILFLIVHSITHIQNFSMFLPFVNKLFFMASNSNRASIKRICQISGYSDNVTKELLKELSNISKDRIEKNIYDCMCLDQFSQLCLIHFQSFFSKSRNGKFLEALDMSETTDATKRYWLVDKNKTKFVCKATKNVSSLSFATFLGEHFSNTMSKELVTNIKSNLKQFILKLDKDEKSRSNIENLCKLYDTLTVMTKSTHSKRLLNEGENQTKKLKKDDLENCFDLNDSDENNLSAKSNVKTRKSTVSEKENEDSSVMSEHSTSTNSDSSIY